MHFSFAPALLFVVLAASCAAIDEDDDVGEGEGEEGEGEGEAALCAEPGFLNFGSVDVGGAFERDVVVTNCGDSDTGFLSVITNGDFAVTSFDSVRLAPNASSTIRIQFAPTDIGQRSGALTISEVDGDLSLSIELSGTGQSGGLGLVVNPLVNAFGEVVVGQLSSVVFALTNLGDAASDVIDVELGGGDANQFVVVDDACEGQSLAPGGACAIEVAFAPLTPGAKAGVLSVNQAVAALTGTGLSDAQLSMSPPSRNFGTVGVGEESTALDFTVTNTGDVSTTGPIGALVDGADAEEFVITASGCDGVPLDAQASCTISVTFSPVGELGARDATLRVASLPGGEVTSALTGTGGSSDSFSINPTAHDFGSVGIGTRSAETLFTIYNVGGHSVVFTTSLSGTDAAQFVIVADSCNGASLDAGAACSVSISFAPTVAGFRAALLSFDSGAAQSSAALVGSGVSVDVLFLNPTGIDFGSVPSGSESAVADIFVLNAGSATAAMTGTMGGANFSQFAIVATTCDAPLAAGGTCTFSVRYQPTVFSVHTAILSVSSSAGATAVTQLTGVGVSQEGMTFAGFPRYDAGDVVIDTQASTTATFTVQQLGTIETGTISTTFAGSGAASFVIVSEDCTTLASGATCSITVRFDPLAPAGAKLAQLIVTATPGGTMTSSDLSGNAVAP